MDLAKLQKKAFFIPTPGQFEQEYIANRLSKMRIAPTCKQNQFSLKHLNLVSEYTGLKNFNSSVDFSRLFNLFHRK